MLHNFSLYIQVYDPSRLNPSVWYKVVVEVHFLLYSYLAIPASFAEKAFLSPLNCDGAFIKKTKQKPIDYIYIWNLNSIPLICLSIIMSVPTLLITTALYLLFFKINYLFLAALGLRCCTQVFSSCSVRRLIFIVVCGLLIAVASLVVEHRRQARRLQAPRPQSAS